MLWFWYYRLKSPVYRLGWIFTHTNHLVSYAPTLWRFANNFVLGCTAGLFNLCYLCDRIKTKCTSTDLLSPAQVRTNSAFGKGLSFFQKINFVIVHIRLSLLDKPFNMHSFLWPVLQLQGSSKAARSLLVTVFSIGMLCRISSWKKWEKLF